MTLDHIAAAVLYRLWKRRRDKDGSLVPAKVIHEELLKGLGKYEFSQDLQVDALKKTLRQLKAEGLVEYGESKKSSRIPGPPPNGYRLSPDAKIITWRATAAIVVWLHNHQEIRVKREVVIDETFKRGLTHHDRDDRLEREEIAELINWCLRKGYIKEENVANYEGVNSAAETRLSTTPKVDECELFLQKLADEVKLQVASESPQVSGGGFEHESQG